MSLRPSSYQGPELLTQDHLVAGFRSGDDYLDTWLRRAPAQRPGSRRTWVVTRGGVIVAAYYASSAAVVHRGADAALRAIRLTRLAVDHAHQRRGLAATLLRHFLLEVVAVAGPADVRLTLVHAKDQQAAAFYRHHGFRPSPIDDLTLMLPIQDIALPASP